MSETNDEKIERLENTVQQLVEMQRGILDLIAQGRQPIVDILMMIGTQNELQTAITKFIASCPSLGSASDREKLMRAVAKAESNQDQCAAMVATIQKIITEPLQPPGAGG